MSEKRKFILIESLGEMDREELFDYILNAFDNQHIEAKLVYAQGVEIEEMVDAAR